MRAFSSWFMVRIGRIECSPEYNILEDAIDVLKPNSRTRAFVMAPSPSPSPSPRKTEGEKLKSSRSRGFRGRRSAIPTRRGLG